jgi:3-hydroxyisobutyrate dehydrogenase-like beta-hydroxyacid dehydrogenase
MAVPLLLAGKIAGEAEALLRIAGFTNIRSVGDTIGQASAIKMIRSVMVKGIEALTAEMLFAAAKIGVVDEVLSSLDASERAISWCERADNNLDRMLLHGRLRKCMKPRRRCKVWAFPR